MAKAAKPPSENIGKALVIVESPAKAKTINKYLGKNFVVKASRGHVRDLPKRKYGIDPGRNFAPDYEILPSHEKIVRDLKETADKSDMVYLATDLDREGEAIAWHLASALDLQPARTKRVIFNEITKSAIADAFKKPHEIDQDKVNAQQARRILDRVVGYELSPLLWKKIAKGLSAGRVQSVAVRIIVEREDEIRRFEPDESWVIEGLFTTQIAAAAKLAADWHQHLNGAAKGEDGPTLKDQARWLGERSAFRAELTELAGESFKAEGALASATGTSGKYDLPNKTFTSAVGTARRVVEALGFKVREEQSNDWADYSRLGLKKITLVGELDLKSAPAFIVDGLETKRNRSRPSPPFTTAALQQAASNQLRFAASRTMKTAQALYEGVDLQDGQGPVGLITYMRTDSTNLSKESIEAVRGYIRSSFGDKYLPDEPNRYSSREGAQEAHEAIRPTDVTRTPDSLRGHLSDEQIKLYTLIWNRFVACQMTPAEWDTTTVRLAAETKLGKIVFKASGRVLVFDGFYKVLGVPSSSDDQLLPPLKQGQPAAAFDIQPEQKFSSPPPRFTEASLVKELEAQGIGRPSTYAAIIETIQTRGYVEQEDRKFFPTARGELVTRKLIEHFPKIMDVKFTRYMEDELDKIESAHLDWVHVLHEFYDPFKEDLGRAHTDMQAVRAEPSEYVCEQCGKPMVYRFGKTGRFLACTGYPDCKNACDVDRDGRKITPVVTGIKCETCGKPMQMRKSKRGPFLGCTGYPDCTQTMPCDEQGRPLRKVKAEEIAEKCPDCGGAMSVKFFRGKSFLGCSSYPTCKGTKPMPEGIYVERPKPQDAGVSCNKCGRPMVIRKSRRGPFLSCSGFPKCRNAMPVEKIEELRKLAESGQIPTPPPTNGKADRKTGPARRGGPNGSKAREKVDPATLGPPPAGFAWTRTGRPVVETWPESPLSCPDCGGEVGVRSGRFGPFFGCSKCSFIANMRGEAKKKADAELPKPDRPKPIPTDVDCPDCGAKMLMRMGKTGRFLGCSAYPKCRKTMEVPPGLLREVGAAAE